MVLAASPQSGVRDLQGLLARLRERGEAATFGTAGLGTTSHLAPAMLLHLTGLKATLVSYRGAGPAMNDLAAGVVDAVIDQTVTMIPAHRGHTAVALAVSGAQRVPQLPEVPTFAEAGLPGFGPHGEGVVNWSGLAAPARTPDAVVARLQAEVATALQASDMQEFLATLASAPGGMPPAAFTALLTEETARWRDVAGGAGIERQ